MNVSYVFVFTSTYQLYSPYWTSGAEVKVKEGIKMGDYTAKKWHATERVKDFAEIGTVKAAAQIIKPELRFDENGNLKR